MSGCPFDVGDVVVCVEEGMINCPNDDLVIHSGEDAVSAGKIVRIIAIEPSVCDDGKPCGCFDIIGDQGDGVAARFRKIDDGVTDEFRHQMRSIGKRSTVPA